MIVTLNELKGYLRIETDDDDSMLTMMLQSAEKTCADILRLDDITELENEENAKIAVLYTATYFYEHREQADHNKLNLTLRALLFGDRSDEF